MKLAIIADLAGIDRCVNGERHLQSLNRWLIARTFIDSAKNWAANGAEMQGKMEILILDGKSLPPAPGPFQGTISSCTASRR